MANPYQAPIDADLAQNLSARTWPLNTREANAIQRGLDAACIGYRLLAGSLLVAQLPGLFFPNAAPRVSILSHAIAGLGLILVMVGLVRWGTVRGPQRMLSLIALAIGVFSATLFTPYVIAIDRGQPVTGLFHLLGATALAMLLTSQALTAIVLRAWAWRKRLGKCVHACDFAVLCFATCAVANTTIAMTRTSATGDALFVIRAVAGFSAILLLTACLHITRRHWRDSEEATTTQQHASLPNKPISDPQEH
ncbi:MAG: hypothetical protein ACR2NZ_14270 [Rubripirellula sp.]